MAERISSSLIFKTLFQIMWEYSYCWYYEWHYYYFGSIHDKNSRQI